jgi:hypothetical protein
MQRKDSNLMENPYLTIFQEFLYLSELHMPMACSYTIFLNQFVQMLLASLFYSGSFWKNNCRTVMLFYVL